MTERGHWAMGYVNDQVFRQHGWTEADARSKVRSDMLRQILRDFLTDANITRAMQDIETVYSKPTGQT